MKVGGCASRRTDDTVGDMRHAVNAAFGLHETEDAVAASGPAERDVGLAMTKNVLTERPGLPRRVSGFDSC